MFKLNRNPGQVALGEVMSSVLLRVVHTSGVRLPQALQRSTEVGPLGQVFSSLGHQLSEPSLYVTLIVWLLWDTAQIEFY